MARFASPDKQVRSVMKELNNKLKSVGTSRNYREALTRVARYISENRLGGLRDLNLHQAESYLKYRGDIVGQKTLDMERQAIQAMFQHVTREITWQERIPVIRAERQQCLKGKAYTPVQVNLIAQAQIERNSLSTKLAYNSGLRAHELLTLRPVTEQPADLRPAMQSKWRGREGMLYTVVGKGGLIREVLIPSQLAHRLEQQRLDQSVRVTDRGIHYEQHYDIGGGHSWSASFSAASSRVLGWSTGGHGLRHSYAQERMVELQVNHCLSYQGALRTTSQEMGHFRPGITEVYLR